MEFGYYDTLCALCSVLEPFTGLHTDTTNIMAEVKGFGKSFQLFMASKVIEVLLTFLNRSSRTDREAVLTGAAIF